jgi:hypothetical protein
MERCTTPCPSGRTSARVGNVQMTPSIVFLIDQMWVK